MMFVRLSKYRQKTGTDRVMRKINARSGLLKKANDKNEAFKIAKNNKANIFFSFCILNRYQYNVQYFCVLLK